MGLNLLSFAGGVTLDLTKKVFLFDNANHLIGTFDTLKSCDRRGQTSNAGTDFTLSASREALR